MPGLLVSSLLDFAMMEISKEDFENRFQETLDNLIENMAGNADIGVREFYHTTCLLENLSFFGPVIYGLLQKPKR
jgi:hypothetical protein